MSLVETIANDLRLDQKYIENIALKSHHYYRHYTIPKKSGGIRDIYHPSAELKTIQYWLNKHVLGLLPISRYAYAYSKGCSIKKNASIHLEAEHLLRIDIRNFFESISTNHLRAALEKSKDILVKNGIILDEYDKNFIDQICFRYGHLKVGAVSSPLISNIILYEFDQNLSKAIKLKSSACIYTRYADDIYVSSSRRISSGVIDIVKTKIQNEGFEVNKKKSFVCSRKSKMKITGIILTKDKRMSIGTKLKKDIKKMIYNKLKYNIGNPNQIVGYLMFLKDIEPNTFNEYIIKYSQYSKSKDVLKDLREEGRETLSEVILGNATA